MTRIFLAFASLALVLALGLWQPDWLLWIIDQVETLADWYVRMTGITGHTALAIKLSGGALVLSVLTLLIGAGLRRLLRRIFTWRKIFAATVLPLLAHAVEWTLGFLWPDALQPVYKLTSWIVNQFDTQISTKIELFQGRNLIETGIIITALLGLWWTTKMLWRHFRRPGTPSTPPTGGSKRNTKMKRRAFRLLLDETNIMIGATVVALLNFYPAGMNYLIGAFIGAFVGGLVFVVIFKERLLFDADFPKRFAMLLEMQNERSGMITQGGQPIRPVYGGMIPVFSSSVFGLWWVFQLFTFSITRYYVYFPFFTTSYSQDLPRCQQTEENGKNKFTAVKKGDQGFRTSHVRNGITTWWFNFNSVEVQSIPFRTEGNVQYYIERHGIEDALYKTDAWNILLDQAVNAAVRSVLREHATIGKIIGNTPRELWAEEITRTDIGEELAQKVKEKLDQFKIEVEENGVTRYVYLKDVAIRIGKVVFTDFVCEDLEVLKKLQVSVFGRESGRAKDLEGQGVAAALTASREAMTGGEHAPEIIAADAFVRATQGGSLDAIAAAIVQKIVKGE